MSKNLSRRTFVKMVAALAASGVLAWKPYELKVEADEGDTLIIDDGDAIEQPFAPYFVDSGSTVFAHWEDMEDGDTWGMPND